MEAVFINARRYRQQNSANRNSVVADSGQWRTMRFVTKIRALEPRMSGSSVTGDSRKRNWMSSSILSSNTLNKTSSAYMTGSGAMRKLFEYSKDRLTLHVKTGGGLGPDSLNDYVTVIRIGPARSDTATMSLPAVKKPRVNGVLGTYCSKASDTTIADHTKSLSSEQCYFSPLSSDALPGMERIERVRSRTSLQSRSKMGQLKRASTTRYGKSTRYGKRMKRGENAGAFPSIDFGIQNSILYRSVLQSRPTIDELEIGEDSDGDVFIDEDWRLELNDRMLTEYLDTSAQEKLFMNMWNQFASKEVYIYADRRLMEAVICFARRYGAVIHMLNLSVIFIRHLGELSKLGLLDATGMHAAVLAMNDSRMAAATGVDASESRLHKFSFYDRLVSARFAGKEGSGQCSSLRIRPA